MFAGIHNGKAIYLTKDRIYLLPLTKGNRTMKTNPIFTLKFVRPLLYVVIGVLIVSMFLL